MMERPAKRPANSVLASGRSAPIGCRLGARPGDYLDRATPDPEEGPEARRLDRRQPALDCSPSEEDEPEAETPRSEDESEAARRRRRRLHRLQLRAPPPRRRTRGLRAWCSTSSPTPGSRENLAGSARRTRLELVEGDIADRDAVRAARRGLRRGRQLRRRVARRPLDRVARRVHHRPTSSAPSSCSRRRATPGSATSRSRPTRSTATSRTARPPRARRSTPPPPTRRRRPAAT